MMMKHMQFSPLPFGRDLWITSVIASMCYIIFLICASFFTVHMTSAGWNENYFSKIIIQLPLSPTDATLPEKAAIVLREDGGIKSYKFVDKSVLENVAKLLSTPTLPEVKIPSFIQAQINPKTWSFESLNQKLKTLHPEFNILDTHTISFKFMENINTLERVFYLLCGMIFATSMLVILVVTRFEVAIYKDIIHILYLLGAKADYIASHFQKRGRLFGLKAGFIGALFGTITYLLFLYLAGAALLEGGAGVSFLLINFIMLPLVMMVCCDRICRWTSHHYIQSLQ